MDATRRIGTAYTLVWACVLGCAGGALSARGDAAEATEAGVTANWAPTAAGSYAITDAANWTGTDRIPTNAADTIHFVPDPAALAGAQTIYFPAVTTSRFAWDLGTFDGATNQTLRGSGRDSNATRYGVVRLGNPNGFLGSYETVDFSTTWRVSATEDFTPFLANVKASKGPVVEVGGDGTARIGRLYGGELLQKAGTGNLAVEDVESAASTRVRMSGGTLTMGQVPDAATSTLPVAGPAVWFDASRTDTLTVDAEPDENGRRFVAEWRDANGGPICARPASASLRPFISEAARAADGTPLVDFGAYRGVENMDRWDVFVSTYGPNGALKLSENLPGVREVFIAWGDWASAGSCAFVVGHTDSYDLHRSAGDYLLAGTWNSALHENDETWIDGVRRTWTYGPYDYMGLTVASFNLSGAGARVNTLAYDRGVRYGGCRIAEVVLYTNELTSVERQAVHGYLLKKWKGGVAGLRELCLTADAAVQVPDGRALDVATLTAPAGGTLTKTGAGALNVADVAEAKTSLRVAEGRVAFLAAARSDGTAPAENPRLWLDASAADSFVAQEVEGDTTGRAYISEWKDCRAGRTLGVAVPAKAVAAGNYPFVVADAANGRPTVDFGGGWYLHWGVYETVTNDSTYMEIPDSGNVSAYEGFTVVRMKMPNGAPSNSNRACLDPSLFASYDMSFARYQAGSILSVYSDPSGLAAQWWVDGAPVWPLDTNFDPGTNEFHVVNFSSIVPLRVRGVAFDRWDIWGGMQICETLFYTRTLSHAERAATMDYLRRKWQGVEPAATDRRELDVLAYEAGADAILASGGPLAVARVALPAGAATFTVTGGGTVTAGGVNLDAEKAVVADGGALVVTAGADGLPEPVYHFDATDAASLETATTEAGETSVLKWKDVRGNGVYAEAQIGGHRKAYPTLRTVETRNGKTMPVLDFGDAAQGTVQPDTAAGMNIRGTDGLVQELHVIYSDAGTTFNGIGHRFIFSDSAYYSFHRDDSNGQIFSAYYQEGSQRDCVRYGYVGVDGEVVPWTWQMTDRAFHLVSAAPTNAVYVRTIALDRNARAGGSYQGELIAFRTPLSASQRAYLQKQLMWKWFGEGEEPAWTFEAASLHVRNGGRIAFAGDTEVTAAALGGAGTVEAGRVTGVRTLAPGAADAAGGAGRLALVGALDIAEEAEIALGFRGMEDYDAVAVSGAVSLPRAAHVTLTVAPGLTGVTGRFRALEAGGAVTGVENVRGWSVTEENGNAFSFALAADEQGVWLVARPKGTVLFFR